MGGLRTIYDKTIKLWTIAKWVFFYFKSSFWCVIIMCYFLFIFVNKCSLINFWMLWLLIKQHTQVFVLHIFLFLYLQGEFYCVLLDKVWSILPALDLLPLELSHRRGSNSNAVKMDQTWSSVLRHFELPHRFLVAP